MTIQDFFDSIWGQLATVAVIIILFLIILLWFIRSL